jgi:hypothetical protein
VGEFSADTYLIGVGQWHPYAVDWRFGSVTFAIDTPIRMLAQASTYPMQFNVNVSGFV